MSVARAWRLALAVAGTAGAVGRDRRALEARIGACLAAYRAGARPRGGDRGELCSLFAAAELDAPSLAALRDAEACRPGVAFVAYARPLVRLPR